MSELYIDQLATYNKQTQRSIKNITDFIYIYRTNLQSLNQHLTFNKKDKEGF
jgi:hypothetical protein